MRLRRAWSGELGSLLATTLGTTLEKLRATLGTAPRTTLGTAPRTTLGTTLRAAPGTAVGKLRATIGTAPRATIGTKLATALGTLRAVLRGTLGRTLGVVLVAGVVVGCSAGAGDEAGEAREAARALFGAVQRGDGAGACAALLPEAARGLATDKSPCAKEILTTGLTGGPIRDVEVWGGRARLRAGDDVVFLADFGSGWRVAAAGCERLPGQDRYDCDVEA